MDHTSNICITVWYCITEYNMDSTINNEMGIIWSISQCMCTDEEKCKAKQSQNKVLFPYIAYVGLCRAENWP